jgi:hypothetical protein
VGADGFASVVESGGEASASKPEARDMLRQLYMVATVAGDGPSVSVTLQAVDDERQPVLHAVLTLGIKNGVIDPGMFEVGELVTVAVSRAIGARS